MHEHDIKYSGFYLLMALLILGTQTVTAQSASGTWITRSALPTPRQEMPLVWLDGKIYVLGGIDTDRNSVDFVEAYDPISGIWSMAASLPPTLHHLGAAVVNDKLYVMGGYITGFTPTNRVFEYNPITDNWTEKSPMPSARGAQVAVTLNDKIYVIGGESLGTALTTNQVYNPIDDTWAELAPMPTAREHLAAAALNGKIYVVGGRTRVNGSLNNLHALESYDPTTDTWDESPANLQQSSGGLAAAALHGRLYAFGGEFFEDGASGVYEMNAEYNPETNTWRNLAPMPVPRHGIGAVAVADTIFIIGGGNVAGYATTNINSGFVPQKPAPTAIVDESTIPALATLLPNYPNPFQGSTTVRYALAQSAEVHLTIHDMLGRTIETLIHHTAGPGEHFVTWQTKGLRRGVYVARLQAGDSQVTETLIKY